jgi:hypothetical protein
MELGDDPAATEDAALTAFLEELRRAGDRLMQSRGVLRQNESELDELRDRLQNIILDEYAARPPTPRRPQSWSLPQPL